MPDLPADWEMNMLVDLTDFVTLVYHEARNVRHLARAGIVNPADWKYLIALPTNRHEAWAALQTVRRSAQAEIGAGGVLRQFHTRFHVALPQLEELFSNPAWRHSSYGGNAWLGITGSVRRLADCLEHGRDEEAADILEIVKRAQHNTGTVAEKLRRLDGLHSETVG